MVEKLIAKEIEKQISDFTGSTVKLQADRDLTYYLGANQTILNTADKEEHPDYKIPVPFGRKIINTIVGYAAKPGLITFTPKDSKQDMTKMNEIFELNNETLETNKAFVEANKYGYAYEVHYVVGNIPEFAKVDARQMIAHYSNEVKPILEWVIRFWEITDLNNTIKYADVYYEDVIEHYCNTGEAYTLSGSDTHKYGEVPIVDYQINEEKQGVFEHVLKMIDQHDIIVSEDIANELGRFADAYLTLSKKLDPEDMDKIRDLKIFDGLGTEGDFVSWLVKNINDTFIQNSADRFERLIYELSQVPNFNDEKFNAQSGIAIAYALVDFENLVAGIESYFTIGLKKRLRLLSTVSGEMGIGDPIDYDIKWMRNLPFNFKELAEVVTKLKGMLSQETLLKMFPKEIVEDITTEIERLDEEKTANMDRFNSQFGTDDDKEDEDVDEDE